MNIGDTIAPTSDQLDAIELVAGPRTFVIERVSKGNAEQPVQIHLVDFPRPWRPGKSMRRVLVAAWGPDASVYVGRRVTLFFDPDVTFGKERCGGTRIAAMSNLKDGKRLSTPLLVTRGKSAIYTVEPLTDAAPTPAAPTVDIATCTDRDELRALWSASDPATRAQIQARIKVLDAGGES